MRAWWYVVFHDGGHLDGYCPEKQLKSIRTLLDRPIRMMFVLTDGGHSECIVFPDGSNPVVFIERGMSKDMSGNEWSLPDTFYFGYEHEGVEYLMRVGEDGVTRETRNDHRSSVNAGG